MVMNSSVHLRHKHKPGRWHGMCILRNQRQRDEILARVAISRLRLNLDLAAATSQQ